MPRLWLQLGRAVAVIAHTSVAANLIAIVGDMVVCRDPVGTGAVGSPAGCSVSRNMSRTVQI